MVQEPFGDLVIDDREAGVFRVNRRVFTDPDILTMEHRRVFEQSWIYVGHASEVPKPGDFLTRKVAGRPIILVRGDDGVVRVLLNTRTHRGAQVCREKTGNGKWCGSEGCYECIRQRIRRGNWSHEAIAASMHGRNKPGRLHAISQCLAQFGDTDF